MTKPTYRRTPLLIGLIVVACLVAPAFWGLQVQRDWKAKKLVAQAQEAFDARQYDRAGDLCQTLVALTPDKEDAWDLLAMTRLYQRRLPEALEAVNRSIALQPAGTTALTLRGQIRLVMNQPDAAIADFSAALAIKPDATEGLISRAGAYETKGQYKQQLDDLRRVCSLRPSAPLPWNNLAWALATCPDASLRDGRQAVLLACQSCDLSDWSVAGYLDTLAAAYAEAGDFPHAVAWEEKCVALSSQPVFLAHLSEFQEGRPHRETAPDDLFANPSDP